MSKKKFTAKVIGLKNLKTATVEVTRIKLEPKYHKPLKIRKKFQVHNEDFSLKIGDSVIIIESRPYSATKRFLVIEKL